MRILATAASLLALAMGAAYAKAQDAGEAASDTTKPAIVASEPAHDEAATKVKPDAADAAQTAADASQKPPTQSEATETGEQQGAENKHQGLEPSEGS
jgi:hypothetical protein